ncbi:MAG: flagellar brake protein [Lachnospiraceae bacterium]|nr:flagellar brake protein [Lachnospiraceae bacterium]
MLTDYVVPGDKLELTDLRSEEKAAMGDGEKKVYSSRIYDIPSEDEIHVNMPMDGTKLILLPVDKELDLCFYTGTGLYQCYARVKDRFRANNVFILCLELTSPLKKFQRREYYRLNCILNMKCRPINDEEYEKVTEFNSVQILNTDLTLQDGTIVDISGGGARFISNEKFEKDAKILFKFALPTARKDTEYEVVGRVILSDEIEGRKGSFQNHIQFMNMDVDQRESIIRYIFEEERRKRKRERGE